MTDKVEDLKKRRGEGGFTLVELLIVLAILAILVAVVLPNFTGLLGHSQETAASAEKTIVQTAVDAKMAAENKATWDGITTATTDMKATTGLGLYPGYMRGTATKGTYQVDPASGEVTQTATGY
jgi:prepilin-type N-terminal cleavage/methylation domain-containing protein